MAVVARALGQMWSKLSDEEKLPYQTLAAAERERVAAEVAKYKLEGLEPHSPRDPSSLIMPTGRIRKICKLDPEVKNVSKEGLILISKCAELALEKLAQEAVKVAQIQNRRKLMPDDIAQICSTREQFLFLREDVKDLVREQKKAAPEKPAKAAVVETNSKPLTAYFESK